MKHFLLLASCVIAAVAQNPTPAAITLRFHHLHYRVPDPGGALAPAAQQLKGTRVLLQGLGVGVRVGQEYVLFDREEDNGPTILREVAHERSPASVYLDVAKWLTARRLNVRPASLADTSVSTGLPDAALDHVAFAADDLGVVRAALKEKAISATDDVLRYKDASGLIIEIVRDTDRPDTYWCPMHPDVRRGGKGTCPRCGMALVPIPTPPLGDYRLDVTMRPRANGGASGFRFAVRHPGSGAAVTSFIDVHERPFHLFIVRRDLETFAHLHPERAADGSFEIKHALDPGEYLLVADFLPAGGTPQLVQRVVATPGYNGPLFATARAMRVGPLEQTMSGLRIRLDPSSPKPRREAHLRFQIADATTGAPVSDLEPYLGAAGHMLLVNADASAAFHAHPEGGPTSGPTMTFEPTLPSAGLYKLWVQVQRQGQVVTAPFVIAVEE
jgi:Heavy metal binding domain